jgi:hypothetical protein
MCYSFKWISLIVSPTGRESVSDHAGDQSEDCQNPAIRQFKNIFFISSIRYTCLLFSTGQLFKTFFMGARDLPF